MTGSSDPIYWSKVFAWVSTAICVIFCARSASVFAKQTPRVFSILALLSLTWAILIPYYYQEQLPELLVGFTGFLFAYIAVLLLREAHNPTPRKPFTDQSAKSAVATEKSKQLGGSPEHGQGVVLFLLPSLILPSTIPVISTIIPFPPAVSTFNSVFLQPVVPTILLLVGYYQIGRAINSYSSSTLGKISMTILLFLYALTDAVYTAFAVYCNFHPSTANVSGPTFFQTPPAPPMTWEFLVSFGILKLLFCGLFVPLVLKESLSAEDNVLSIRDKVQKWMGITIFHPQAPAISSPVWTGIAGEYLNSSGVVRLCHDKVELVVGGSNIAGQIETTEVRVRKWVVEGSYKQGILALRYWPKEGELRGIGALVLERDEKTGAFKGCWLGYDRTKNQIGAGPYVLSTDCDTDAVEKANSSWLVTPCYFPGSGSDTSAAGAK